MLIPQSIARHRARTYEAPIDLRTPSSAHLVGICGSGMKALAELLVDLGWQVTGSDLERPSRSLALMKERGLRVHRGHNEQHLPAEVALLIYSQAVGTDNPERLQAKQLGVPQLSYSQVLGELMRDRTGVSIAGTHGKSTTTAMTASILQEAGCSPSAVVGAELCGVERSGWAGAGEFFVVESCEYRKSFLDLQPRFATILGIEPDHFDCYQNLDEAQAAFAEFAGQVSPSGLLLVKGDCAASVAAARSAVSEVATFSDQPGADWLATDLRPTATGTRFRIFQQGRYFTEISLRIPGCHNVLNALAATALCQSVGVTAHDIRGCLEEFQGVKRRYEYVGSWRGMTLIDDYAHHPTAVRTTLNTARRESGRRRIWCAFQPHQASRTRALMDEFADSFESADEVLIAPTFAAREGTASGEATEASQTLASRIGARGSHARYCSSLDRVISTLDDEARPGDVLITMGAGDINRVHHEFTRRLQRHHASR